MLNYDNDIVFKTLMLKGDKGAQGTSIVSIEKTSTVGLVDTYTITLNDGTEYEFTVTNGTNSYYDSELSDESENAVQNKVIKGVIDTINATLVSIQEYDSALSSSSENAVQNKVIKDAIDTINTALETIQQYDSALSASSENAVQNKVVKAAIDLKADSSALADYYTKTEIDAEFNNLGASNIPYNNTSSGLQATDTQAAIDEVVNRIYPVGSIYLSVTDSTAAAVAARFGGTWVAFGSGKTLVGVDTTQTEFNTVEKTGGEKTHILKPKEMPSRIIGQLVNSTGSSAYLNGINAPWGSPTIASGGSCASSLADGYAAGFKVFGESAPEQADQPHNNLQPYITVYMYKRTA